MTDSRHLHKEAADLRLRAQAKLRDAERANSRAQALSQGGDFERAAYENEQATRWEAEAVQFELEAAQRDADASIIESQLTDIDRQEVQIQAECKAQIEALERQKRSIRGY